jgi:hypothetical protein
MEFKKIRLKVPVLEAVQIDTDNLDEIAEWIGGSVVGDTLRATIVRQICRYPGDDGYEETAYLGDWFLRNTENGQIDMISGEGYHKFYCEVGHS